MKTKLLALLTSLLLSSLAAQDTENVIDEALNARISGQYAQLIERADRWRFLSPENGQPLEYMGYGHLMQGHYAQAIEAYTAGLWIDPGDATALVGQGHALALSGKTKEARDAYAAGFLFLDTEVRQAALKELIDISRAVGGSASPAAFADLVKDPLRLTPTPEFRQVMADAQTWEEAAGSAKRFIENYRQAGRQDLVLMGYCELHRLMQSNGRYSEALAVARQGYTSYKQSGHGGNPVQASRLLDGLLSSLESLEDFESMSGFAQDIAALLDRIPVQVYSLSAMNRMAMGYFQTGNYEENLEWSKGSYYRVMRTDPSILQYQATQNMAIAYGLASIPEGPQRSVEFAQAAVEMTRRFKLTGEQPQAMATLAIRLFALGTPAGIAKGLETIAQSAAVLTAQGRFYAAANAYNNAGTMFYHQQNFSGAIPLFDKAAELSRKAVSAADVSTSDRLTFYKQQTDIQSWLAVCHARLGQADGAFDAMERSRAVVLRERAGNGGPPVTLQTFQKMLKPDEAALFFLKFSGHEVAIVTVTARYSSVTFHSDDTFIGDIKDKYLDRMKKEHDSRRGMESDEPVNRNLRVSHQDFNKVLQLTRRFFENPGTGDDVLHEFLNGYYRFLILPVLNRLTGFKRLILSPDMEYNLIPFEALRTGDGKYLAEKFEIRYIPSASLWRDIRDRNHPANRQPLLAMGGAKFSDINASPEPLESAGDLNQLLIKVEENQKNGRSQRSAYAAVFGNRAMNELPGTVAEVRHIGKTIPGSRVLIGPDMSEPGLKAMSASGELGRYRILHLATHGFVVDMVPALSGVAMTIGPEEDRGEDGFLTTGEIASLGLKTDLTVLSACQTALGKIYAGEGVAGLTHSLIAAGSNAALVSLWPVNDNSTMLFMSAFYEEVKKGKSYPQIVSELKRKFIKGEFGDEYRHPNFWAPFVYIGD